MILTFLIKVKHLEVDRDQRLTFSLIAWQLFFCRMYRRDAIVSQFMVTYEQEFEYDWP